MMQSAIDIHALTTMLAHSNQILSLNNYHQPARINSLLSVHFHPFPTFVFLQDPVSRERDRVAHPFDFEELVDIRAGEGTIASKI